MNGEHTPIEKASAELRAAVSRMPFPTPRRAKSWHPVAAFVAAALVVLVVIGVPILLGQVGGNGSSVGEATSTTTATSVVEAVTTTVVPERTTSILPANACGTEPPFVTVLPADFTGPVAGPSPQSSHPAEPGQLVWHWTGRGGSVEMRWPADHEYTKTAEWGANRLAPDADAFSFVPLEGSELDEIPQLASYASLPTELMDGPCDAVQLGVLGADGSVKDNALFGTNTDAGQPNTLILYPDLPRPRDLSLIVESLNVDTVPEVVECSGGSEAAGFEVPPNKGGTIIDRVVFPTPVEALEAFVAGRDTWSKTGYFELHEPDGSITYGNPLDDLSPDPRPENGLVISISVVEEGEGWAVDSWSSSGC